MNTKMSMILFIGLILWFLILVSNPARAMAPTKVLSEKEMLVIHIREESKKYNIDPIKLQKTLDCESSFNHNAKGDGGKSRGIAQIHKRWHPDVSDKQAFDPYWSISWAAKRFSEGHASEWTCYRELFM